MHYLRDAQRERCDRCKKLIREAFSAGANDAVHRGEKVIYGRAGKK